VHPFDDVRVIAGQGTAALELLQDHADIGLMIVPISGGGLTMGTAIAAHGLDPGIEVWAAEPSGADDAYRSLEVGHIVTDYGHTIADGLRAHLSPRTFAGLREHDVRIVRVDDDEIVAAMRFLFERTKLVVEPAGACSLAGLLALAARGVALPPTVAVVLSGGNVDLDHLPFT
jgi:threonine dehydratase